MAAASARNSTRETKTEAQLSAQPSGFVMAAASASNSTHETKTEAQLSAERALDLWQNLTSDFQVTIWSFLDERSLQTCSQVCKWWKGLAIKTLTFRLHVHFRPAFKKTKLKDSTWLRSGQARCFKCLKETSNKFYWDPSFKRTLTGHLWSPVPLANPFARRFCSKCEKSMLPIIQGRELKAIKQLDGCKDHKFPRRFRVRSAKEARKALKNRDHLLALHPEINAKWRSLPEACRNEITIRHCLLTEVRWCPAHLTVHTTVATFFDRVRGAVKRVAEFHRRHNTRVGRKRKRHQLADLVDPNAFFAN